MKIVCDNCSTKYSIADEKVRGKVFKIKCKKCSHVIVVKGQDIDGAQAGFDQKETRVFDYSGFDGKEGTGGGSTSPPPSSDAVWHLVIDREQVGPLSAAEVQQKWASGEIDSDTYTWREGFGDWQHLSAVDELAHVVQTQRAGGGRRDLSELRDEAGPSSSPNMFSGANIQDSGPTGRADPTDLFAAAAANDDEGGGELFAKQAAAQPEAVFSSAGGGGGARRAKEDLFAGAGADDDASDSRQQMTAQRNENSVLFSLNNLAAMATESNKSPSPGAAAVAAQSMSASGAGSDGSGLIDIRAMAAMTLGQKSSRADAGIRPSGSTDDLPVFSGASFSSPAQGVLLPTAGSEGPSKVVYILVGLVGLLALSAIGLVLFIVLGQKKTEVANVPPAASASDPLRTAPPAPPPLPDRPSAPAPAAPSASPPGAPASAAPAIVPNKPEKPATTPDKPGKPEKPADKPRDKPTAAVAPSPPPPRTPEPPSRATPPSPPEAPSRAAAQKCDEVACLVTPDLPCCPKRAQPAPTPVNSNLKDKLEQSDIIAGMKNVGGKVAGCNDEYKVPGQMKVKITINGEGQVTNSVAVGTFAGTPSGSCVERAVRGARFMKWKGPSLTFTYPYTFH